MTIGKFNGFGAIGKSIPRSKEKLEELKSQPPKVEVPLSTKKPETVDANINLDKDPSAIYGKMGLHLSKTEAGTAARFEKALAEDPFFAALNAEFGISQEMSVLGADPQKLARYMSKGISDETQNGFNEQLDIYAASQA